MSGVPMLPVFIGFFAASEAFKQAEKKMVDMPLDKAFSITSSIKDMFPTLEEMKRSVKVIIHSGLIGSFIGVLPGAGATIAAFLGYNETKRWSKRPELFGTGIMEGVAAPESANNAAVGGALVPMLTLGIPAPDLRPLCLVPLWSMGYSLGRFFLRKTLF